MKKIGKKLNYFTKVFLVISLLFSNLSGLSVVFAYEKDDNFQVNIDDSKMIVKYTGELEDEDEIIISVTENYTDKSVIEKSYDSNASEITSEEGYVIESPMLNSVVFDGLYEYSVILIVNGEELTKTTGSKNIIHDSGLGVSVYDDSGNLLVSEDGIYNVSGNVIIKYKVLSGGLNPNESYTVDGFSYKSDELIEKEFSQEVEIINNLYGEYVIPIDVELLNSNGENEKFSNSVSLTYGAYQMNTDSLNEKLESLDDYNKIYAFYGDTQDGTLYVLDDLDNHSVSELIDIVGDMGANISFKISNSKYSDVTVAGEELNNIKLDDETVISLTSSDLTITYRCFETKIDELVKLIVSGEENDTADFDRNGTLDIKDVMILQQIIKNNTWNVEVNEVDANIESVFRVNNDDITSGDEFSIDYVLTLSDNDVNGISGTVTYDEEMLELVSIESDELSIGSYNAGKFVYLDNDSLLSENDYVVLTITFKALKQGSSNVSIENLEFINQSDYLNVDNNSIETDVVVNSSSDNYLESVIVNGQTIDLSDDVMDYEITVSNDVNSVDVLAYTKNIAAKISSIRSPEELVEGKNVITIQVEAENGNVRVYTVTVIRLAKEENNATVTSVKYDNSSNEEDDEQTVVTPVTDSTDNISNSERNQEDDGSSLSRIIIIILILLVIAGLIYLIFKDDSEDDDEISISDDDVRKVKKDSSKQSSNSKKKNGQKKK